MKSILISLNSYSIRTLVLIMLVVECSCSNRESYVAIHPKLIFSESDTFVTSLGNTVYNKHDYYLIKNFSKNKDYMKKSLDSFVKTHQEFSSSQFGNYLVFFYLEDSELNETVVNQIEKEYRYRIFDYKKDECFIACYTFRDSKVSWIDWNSRYHK
jgi:hypothetical protein